MGFFIRYKKLIIIISFIILILALGYLLFALFFKPALAPAEPKKTPAAATTPAGLPEALPGTGQIITPTRPQNLSAETPAQAVKPSTVANGGLTKTNELNTSPSLAPTLAGNGLDVQFYDRDDGKFYQINSGGDMTLLSEKQFHNVESIAWSANGNKAVLEYPDGANIIYDFTADKQITLPTHWEDFNFSPSGDKIAMKSIGFDPDNRWLAVANDDGSRVQAIAALGDKNETVYPAWSPNSQIVAMFTEGIGFDRQEVFFVGLNNENFKSTVVEGRGFEPLWAPDENRLLYSVYSSANDLKPNLWLVNADGDNIGTGKKNLQLETWAHKCAFSKDAEVYCAVPESLEPGAGLFPQMALDSSDRLFKIDTRTGMKKLIAIPDKNFSMSNLIVSDSGDYLYFTDAKTGRINKINLK